MSKSIESTLHADPLSCTDEESAKPTLSVKPMQASAKERAAAFATGRHKYARNLIRAFFRRSLWLTLILSLVLAVILPSMLYVMNMSQYKKDSIRLLENFIRNDLAESPRVLLDDPQKLARTVEKIEIFLGFSDFVDFKIWTDQSAVAYSYSSPEQAGQVYEGDDLAEVLSTGKIHIEVEKPHDEENIHLEGIGRVLEMYAPVKVDGRILGAVEVYRKAPPFELINVHIFCVLAVVLIMMALLYLLLFGQFKKAAETIIRDEKKLNSAYRKIGFSYFNTIRSLLKALELRDMETEGHSERGVALAIYLGEKFHLSHDEMNKLVLGAYLHDIGKIGIPDSILLKPGRLTPDEMEIVKTHVKKGSEIIGDVAFLQPATEVILYHHEKWDGSGYPHGLKQEDIPVPGRIFAIVDVFEALLSERPYKKAMPFAAAKQIILEGAGSHFDPALIALFREIEEEDMRSMAAEIHERGVHSEVKKAVENLLGDFVTRQNIAET